MSVKKGRKRGLKLSNPRKLFMKKPVFDSLNSAELPRVPSILIQHILDNPEIMDTEGIFRVPGNNAEIQAMLKTYSKKNSKALDHNAFSAHTNACALKQWIRDMTDPLLTFELYDSWLACSAISDPREHLPAVIRCVSLLPKANRALLKKLCYMLNEVLLREETNKMSARNLAIVFGPTILRSEDESDPMRMLDEQLKLNKTVEVLIGNFADIFDKNSDDIAVKTPGPLVMDKQMSVQEAEFYYKLQEGGVRIAKTIIVEQQKQSMQQLVASRPAQEPWKGAEPASDKTFAFPPPPAHLQKPNNDRRRQLYRTLSKATATLPVPEWSTVRTPPCRPRRNLALSLQREADEEREAGEEPEEPCEAAEVEISIDIESELLSIEDIVNGIISGEMDTVQDYLANVECAEVVELHSELTSLEQQMKDDSEDASDYETCSDRASTPDPNATEERVVDTEAYDEEESPPV